MTINAMMQATDAAARTLGITLQLLEVRGADELDRAFSAMTRDRAYALLVLPSAMFFNARQRVIDLATEHQLPAMCPAREFATIGGLVAYGASVTDLYRRSAGYVDKILKGANPADLPVEQPTKFKLVVKSQDRQGPRPYDCGTVSAARRRGDRIRKCAAM